MSHLKCFECPVRLLYIVDPEADLEPITTWVSFAGVIGVHTAGVLGPERTTEPHALRVEEVRRGFVFGGDHRM